MIHDDQKEIPVDNDQKDAEPLNTALENKKIFSIRRTCVYIVVLIGIGAFCVWYPHTWYPKSIFFHQDVASIEGKVDVLSPQVITLQKLEEILKIAEARNETSIQKMEVFEEKMTKIISALSSGQALSSSSYSGIALFYLNHLISKGKPYDKPLLLLKQSLALEDKEGAALFESLEAYCLLGVPTFKKIKKSYLMLKETWAKKMDQSQEVSSGFLALLKNIITIRSKKDPLLQQELFLNALERSIEEEDWLHVLHVLQSELAASFLYIDDLTSFSQHIQARLEVEDILEKLYDHFLNQNSFNT